MYFSLRGEKRKGHRYKANFSFTKRQKKSDTEGIVLKKKNIECEGEIANR